MVRDLLAPRAHGHRAGLRKILQDLRLSPSDHAEMRAQRDVRALQAREDTGPQCSQGNRSERGVTALAS